MSAYAHAHTRFGALENVNFSDVAYYILMYINYLHNFTSQSIKNIYVYCIKLNLNISIFIL